jgi:hypothetical protein
MEWDGANTGNGSGTDCPFALFAGISRPRESALGTSTARSKTIYMDICNLDMHHSIYFVLFWRVTGPQNVDGGREGETEKGGYVCTDNPTARDWSEGFPFHLSYRYFDRFGSFILFSSKQLRIAFERLVFCISVIFSVIGESSLANLAFYLCFTTFHDFYEEQIPLSAPFALSLTHRTYTAKRFSRTKIMTI